MAETVRISLEPQELGLIYRVMQIAVESMREGGISEDRILQGMLYCLGAACAAAGQVVDTSGAVDVQLQGFAVGYVQQRSHGAKAVN